MKQKILCATGILGLALVFVILTGCDLFGGSSSNNNKETDYGIYNTFYNYPAGRTSANGMVTVRVLSNGTFLTFMNEIEGVNYLGTIQGIGGSITVTLPAEQFYTIIIVAKDAYEMQGKDAAQASSLIAYSNTLRYQLSISPNGLGSGGTWVLNNPTPYWVDIRKADGSESYVVLPPQAQRVTIGIDLDAYYPYIPRFHRELKYKNKVVSMVEIISTENANEANVTSTRRTYTTTISNAKITPNIKPAIILNNNTQDTVRVYYQNNLITNGEFREDFAVVGGVQEFITGFEQTQNIQNIKFKALAWTSGDKTIQNDVVMQNNKVYIINLTNDGGTLAPHTEQNPNPAPIDDYIR